MYDRFYYDHSTPLQGCGRSFMDFRHVHSTLQFLMEVPGTVVLGVLSSIASAARMVQYLYQYQVTVCRCVSCLVCVIAAGAVSFIHPAPSSIFAVVAISNPPASGSLSY